MRFARLKQKGVARSNFNYSVLVADIAAAGNDEIKLRFRRMRVIGAKKFAFRDPHYHARFVNWLPRRLATPYLRLAGVVKDNTRFADRQTLEEMHYYRYGQLRRLFAREGFANLLDAGEMKIKQHLPGWKGMLQKTGLLPVCYSTYRSLIKSTYLVMAVKN